MALQKQIIQFSCIKIMWLVSRGSDTILFLHVVLGSLKLVNSKWLISKNQVIKIYKKSHKITSDLNKMPYFLRKKRKRCLRHNLIVVNLCWEKKVGITVVSKLVGKSSKEPVSGRYNWRQNTALSMSTEIKLSRGFVNNHFWIKFTMKECFLSNVSLSQYKRDTIKCSESDISTQILITWSCLI